MSILESLIAMGFKEEYCKQAMTATRCAGAEQAIQWLCDHPEGNGTTPSAGNVVGAAQPGGAAAPEAEPEVKFVLKCDDCDKMFASSEQCERHGIRTGHQNFSQVEDADGTAIKPLTEEEKKAKLKALEVRIKARREAKKKEDELESFEKERQRILQGKSSEEIKKKVELDEVKKNLAERKRDKDATRDAKLKVLRDIEEDKERRRLARAGPEEQAKQAEAARKKAEEAKEKAALAPKRNYDECRLQFRLPRGPPVQQTFPSTVPLSAVVEWLTPRHPALPGKTIALSTAYPKKVFSGAEMDMTLQDLKLVPASSLNVIHK